MCFNGAVLLDELHNTPFKVKHMKLAIFSKFKAEKKDAVRVLYSREIQQNQSLSL